MGQKHSIKNCHTFIASQYENQEAVLTGKQTINKEGKAPDIFFRLYHAKLTLVYMHSL